MAAPRQSTNANIKKRHTLSKSRIAKVRRIVTDAAQVGAAALPGSDDSDSSDETIIESIKMLRVEARAAKNTVEEHQKQLAANEAEEAVNG